VGIHHKPQNNTRVIPVAPPVEFEGWFLSVFNILY
jgi:hypothetical protein